MSREGCSELVCFRELEEQQQAVGQQVREWDQCVDRGNGLQVVVVVQPSPVQGASTRGCQEQHTEGLAAPRHGSWHSRFSSADRRHESGGVGKTSLLKEKKKNLNHKVLLKKGQNPFPQLCGMCLQEAPVGDYAGLFCLSIYHGMTNRKGRKPNLLCCR